MITYYADALVSLQILGQTYQVAGEDFAVEQWHKAAQMVDASLRELKEKQKDQPLESLAILAAIHLCQQFLIFRDENERLINQIHDQLQNLSQKFEETLQNVERVA